MSTVSRKTIATPKNVIYVAWCICHPEGGVRYVGLTSKGLNSRWSVHLWHARTESSSSYQSKTSRWIRKHGPDSIVFSVLEECLESELDEREIYWIKFFRESGQDLTNILEGGAQPRGHRNPGASEKMRGSGNHMYGRKRKELMDYARSFQGKASESTKKKMSDAHKGALNARAVLTEVQVHEIRAVEKYHGFYSQMARKFNVSVPTIVAAYNRETWSHI